MCHDDARVCTTTGGTGGRDARVDAGEDVRVLEDVRDRGNARGPDGGRDVERGRDAERGAD